MSASLEQAALDYHAQPEPGKIGIAIKKPTDTQEALSLAYTPGVAAPVMAIAEHPHKASLYTAKNNLVGVITNGTAVLGLGNVGALASKPVMEGKAVLFKRFANVDVFDIEVDANSPEAFIDTVVNIAPTFGGINLEDIQAPECFMIEKALHAKLDIPVFHDDQHGTAIVIAAGLLNALALQGKQLNDVTIVCLGAGAAGIASIELRIALGASPERMLMVDRQGVIHTKRSDLNPYKAALAVETDKRDLSQAIDQADVLIGVSGPNLVSQDMLKSMAPRPIVFALSNPNPEIDYALAHDSRSDLILATGRSDYPNQINNVLCFPYIFRGALDANATSITQAMKIAAVKAIAKLAHEPVPQSIIDAYPSTDKLAFGPTYIIPKPVDPRLLETVAPAVALAAKTDKV